MASTRSAATDVEEIRDQRRRLQHLLEVVEHQSVGVPSHASPRAPWQVECRGVQHAERLGNRGRHERGVPDRGQSYEQDTGFALYRDRTRDLQRQTSLPDSSWPRERDETYLGSSNT